MTNCIDRSCGNCNMSDGTAGLPLNEYSCIAHSEISAEILKGCLHLTTKDEDSHFHCDLCMNLNYPDTEGICRPLKDLNCIASNGRSETCLLCMKNTIYNE